MTISLRVEISGLTVAIATSIFWFFNYMVNQVVPVIIGSVIEVYGFLFIVVVVNFLAIGLIGCALPETKVTVTLDLVYFVELIVAGLDLHCHHRPDRVTFLNMYFPKV